MLKYQLECTVYTHCQTAHFLFCFFNFTQWVNAVWDCVYVLSLEVMWVCLCVLYLCLWMRPENSLYNSIKHPATAEHFMYVDMLKRKSISYTCKRITFIFINLSSEHIHTHVYMSKIRHLFESLFFGWRFSSEITAVVATAQYQVAEYLSFSAHTHTVICVLNFRYDFLCSYISSQYMFVLVLIHNCSHFWSYHIHCVCCSSIFPSPSPVLSPWHIFMMMRSSLGRVFFLDISSSLALENLEIKKEEERNERIPTP